MCLPEAKCIFFVFSWTLIALSGCGCENKETRLTTLIYIVTIKNSIIFIILLYWTSKFIFIVLFLFLYFTFYVDCIRSGIMIVYKLIFQYFRLVLFNNNSE
jgi:hypothetical protein